MEAEGDRADSAAFPKVSDDRPQDRAGVDLVARDVEAVHPLGAYPAGGQGLELDGRVAFEISLLAHPDERGHGIEQPAAG